MRVKMILPALTEAVSPFFRPIKYSLFPPLGLATLAAYLSDDDEIDLQDEHVEKLNLDDDPELVVIQPYITSAYRAYEIADHYRAKGAYVCMGGLHVTSLPDEAASHADSIFLGPGEDIWPEFLRDYKAGRAKARYTAASSRSIYGIPPIRRDLIKSHLYMVPNSIVVSRGCPHKCDFCYKEAFFEGGNSFYVQKVDEALAEIDRLPGSHLYFLDDHLLGNPRFASMLFDGMKGMGRLFQGAATVNSILKPGLLEQAAEAGLRSIFVGLETIDETNLRKHAKVQNLNRDYTEAIRRIHDNGVMINGSFVFGMDEDGPDVFKRTVDWAKTNSIETSTFHIMTPYPTTGLYQRMEQEGRLLHSRWDEYDTRHVVYQPKRMTPEQLEEGYWWAYKEFYTWRSIWEGASNKRTLNRRLRHMAYAGGWKKFEGLWNVLIRSRQVSNALPVLESVLGSFGKLANPEKTEAQSDSQRIPDQSNPQSKEERRLAAEV